MISFEILLILGSLGFYLYGSSMLLYINEAVFIKGRRSWYFSYPETNWSFLGRQLYIPNPLTPEAPIFRLYWTVSNQQKINREESLESLLTTIIPLQYLMMILLMFFFIWLPTVLFLYGSGPQLLWMFGIIYLNISVILVFIYRNKKILGISNKKYIALVFESLACAPFSLNILRKITLSRPPNKDPIELASDLLEHEAFKKFLGIVIKRIDEQLELMDIDNPRYASLESYKNKIHRRRR